MTPPGDEYIPLFEPRSSRSANEIKSYSGLVAYGFALNYVLGIGNLALPYALYQAGLVVGTIILIIMTGITLITVNWVVEVIYKANQIHDLQQSARNSLLHKSKAINSSNGHSHSFDSEEEEDIENAETMYSSYNKAKYSSQLPISFSSVVADSVISPRANNSSNYIQTTPISYGSVLSTDISGYESGLESASKSASKPSNPDFQTNPYEIRTKYEIVQLCDIFLGRSYRNSYQICLCFLMISGLFAYTSVFCQSIQSNLLPHSYQTDSIYLVIAVLFGVIVVPLSCLDLTDQITVQISLTLLRFVTLFLMIGSAAISMWSNRYDSGVYQAFHNPDNPSTPGANNNVATDHTNHQLSAPYIELSLFNFAGMGLMFTSSIFSQLFQHSIPGLIQPIQNKSQIRTIFSWTLITTLVLYITLGSICALYFGHLTLESINLNWNNFTYGYTKPNFLNNANSNYQLVPKSLRAINSLIVLFPALDTVSVFPLIAITLGNSLFSTLPSLGKKGNRILAALPPILGSVFIRDLSSIIRIAGVFGIGIALITPALLQLVSNKRAAQAKVSNPFQWQFSTNFWIYLVLFISVIAIAAVLAPLIC
jgi:amino acid permease